jgi:8-oxo-dGTP pyrophosphatase MutT (NUDIX family)
MNAAAGLKPINGGKLPWSPFLVLGGRRQAVGAILFDPDGRLLLVHDRLRREWSYPAGYVDRGEEHLQAVVREMREELGLQLDPERFTYLSTHALDDRPTGPLDFKTYRADITTGEATGIHRQFIELTDHRWVTPDEALELIAPRFKLRLHELLQR